MQVAAEERAKKDQAAASKKAKHQERVKELAMLTQQRDRLRREEEASVTKVPRPLVSSGLRNSVRRGHDWGFNPL